MNNNREIKADIGIIGGSSTFSIDFPAAFDYSDIKIIQRDLVFETPFGSSPTFILFTLGENTIFTCKMHGWRRGVSRADASRQIFWVFQQAGIKTVIAEGGVGAVNHLLDLRDIVIPTDYLDNSMRKDVSLGSDKLLIMRDPVCPNVHKALYSATKKHAKGRVFSRGIYAVTDGRHFESRAEVASLRLSGADVVGQSMCPEVYLAREIGACYAGLYLIVNYAEGVVEDWSHEELTEIFYNESEIIGNIVLDTVRDLNIQQTPNMCTCADLSKTTLLKEDQ